MYNIYLYFAGVIYRFIFLRHIFWCCLKEYNFSKQKKKEEENEKNITKFGRSDVD